MPTTTAQDGTTIAYEVHGDGEPVVLVHGITESGANWDPIVARLADRYRVGVVDLRGHGRSGPGPDYGLASLAGDVAAVAAAAALDRPRVVGHSLGGMVATALAGAFPVRSVVNVDQPLRLDGFQDQLRQVLPALRDPASFPMVIAGLFEELAGNALDPAERARIEANRRPDQDVVLAIWEPVLDLPAEELAAMVDTAAAAVTCPYLALHGIDPGLDYVAWLTASIPTATVEVWDGLGHYPHLVDPDRFVDRLEAFWQTD